MIIHHCPQIESIKLRKSRQANSEPTTPKFHERALHLTTIELTECQIEHSTFPTYATLPSVTNLTIQNCIINSIHLQCFPALQNLKFHLTQRNSQNHFLHIQEESLLSHIKGFKLLKTLSLIEWSFPPHFLNFFRNLSKNLEEINLLNTVWHSHPFTSLQIKPDLIGVFPKVTSLNVACRCNKHLFIVSFSLC